jgi:drug/metabolite transporter (DMT)-like permease
MRSPTLTGVGYALAGAVCFGVATPLLQSAAGALGTFTTAALLYAGAATGALLATTLAAPERPVERQHLLRLCSMALLGGAVAPALMIYGLAHANGAEACLLLNVETVFTAVLGVLLFRERMGWRFVVGLTAITIAASLLVGEASAHQRSELVGLAAICAATLVWSADNALSLELASLDSSEVVFVKSALGGMLTAMLALAFEPVPEARQPLVVVFLCGIFGYGAMERFYLLAQRHLGVARASSVSAVAPFFAAAVAVLVGAEVGPLFVLAGLMMAVGVYMHASEQPLDLPRTRDPDGVEVPDDDREAPADQRPASRAARGS